MTTTTTLNQKNGITVKAIITDDSPMFHWSIIVENLTTHQTRLQASGTTYNRDDAIAQIIKNS